MDPDVLDVHNALMPGERLIWWGRPDPSVNFGVKDAYLIPFSLLWGGFAIFWEYQVIAGHSPAYFAVFGIPFVGIGLFMIVGRFFAKSFLKRRTLYVLTATRAIVLRGRSWMAEQPLAGSPITVATTSTHVSVHFGGATGSFFDAGRNSDAYANTGMDLIPRAGARVQFFDVADAEALQHALAEIRVLTAR